MNKVKCIIIEDEKPAQEVLTSFISRVNTIDLKATFDDAVSALDYLKSHETDLIFLDIQIPSVNGINFLKILKTPPQVIITSAYSRYALDAFDLDVRDYLLKPIAFERFLKAIERLTPQPETKNIYQHTHSKQPVETDVYAFFNVNKTRVKVRFKEILYVESMREYVYIHTLKGKVVTKIGIGEMERMLGEGFIRTHRSYLVNEDKVTAYNAEEVFIENHSIPIGGNYKKLVEGVLWRNVIS